MLPDEITALGVKKTSRRTIVKTGTKMAYAAPNVAASMKLGTQGASAASPVLSSCELLCQSFTYGDGCSYADCVANTCEAGGLNYGYCDTNDNTRAACRLAASLCVSPIKAQ
jgi:hypothetical protein